VTNNFQLLLITQYCTQQLNNFFTQNRLSRTRVLLSVDFNNLKTQYYVTPEDYSTLETIKGKGRKLDFVREGLDCRA
jgi:hypothetical protein